VSPVSLQDFTLRGTLSAPPSSRHLGNPLHAFLRLLVVITAFVSFVYMLLEFEVHTAHCLTKDLGGRNWWKETDLFKAGPENYRGDPISNLYIMV
jgi:hypothetical protein